MRVGWLADPGNLDGSRGGAEYTADELKAAAPDKVEVVDCPPGKVQVGLDAYVVHNCWLYPPPDLDVLGGQRRVIRFVHDQRGPGPADASADSLRVFYSPLQRAHCRLSGELIPPPLQLARFEPNGGGVQRSGAVAIGTWGHHGKGPRLLDEWAAANGPLVVYGPGPCRPSGPNVEYRGVLPPDRIAETLWQFETFVHLPTDVEAFGRGVVEAWAAGCDLCVNGNVGALWWLENRPEAIDSAAADFWDLVVDA